MTLDEHARTSCQTVEIITYFIFCQVVDFVKLPVRHHAAKVTLQYANQNTCYETLKTDVLCHLCEFCNLSLHSKWLLKCFKIIVAH